MRLLTQHCRSVVGGGTPERLGLLSNNYSTTPKMHNTYRRDSGLELIFLSAIRRLKFQVYALLYTPFSVFSCNRKSSNIGVRLQREGTYFAIEYNVWLACFMSVQLGARLPWALFGGTNSYLGKDALSEVGMGWKWGRGGGIREAK